MIQKNLKNFINGSLSTGAAKDFKQAVLSTTGKSEQTWFRWMRNDDNISRSDKTIIAQLAGKPVNELFPEPVNH